MKWLVLNTIEFFGFLPHPNTLITTLVIRMNNFKSPEIHEQNFTHTKAYACLV